MTEKGGLGETEPGSGKSQRRGRGRESGRSGQMAHGQGAECWHGGPLHRDVNLQSVLHAQQRRVVTVWEHGYPWTFLCTSPVPLIPVVRHSPQLSATV